MKVASFEEKRENFPVLNTNLGVEVENMKIGIIYASWHEKYISMIREKCRNHLLENGISQSNIEEIAVPGCNEIPLVASKVAKRFDGIICVGILVKVDSTLHFENLSYACSNGIMQAQIQTGVPMMNVILSCYDYTQVEDRVSGEKCTLDYVVKGLLGIISTVRNTQNIKTVTERNAQSKRIGIIYASWHEKYISLIREKCRTYLLENGIVQSNIEEISVPGSNEIPFVASKLYERFDGIICVGILIKGETLHFENISYASSNGIMQAQIQTGIPMMNVILSCQNYDQVEERITGEKCTLEYVVKGLLQIVNSTNL